MTIGTSTGEVFDSALDMHAASFASSSAGAIKGGVDTPNIDVTSEDLGALQRGQQQVDTGKKAGAAVDDLFNGPNPGVAEGFRRLHDAAADTGNQVLDMAHEAITNPRGFAANIATGGELGVMSEIPKGNVLSELSMVRTRKSAGNDNALLPNGGKDPFMIESEADMNATDQAWASLKRTADKNATRKNMVVIDAEGKHLPANPDDILTNQDKYDLAVLDQKGKNSPSTAPGEDKDWLDKVLSNLVQDKNKLSVVDETRDHRSYDDWVQMAKDQNFLTRHDKLPNPYKAAQEASKGPKFSTDTGTWPDGKTTVIVNKEGYEFVYKDGIEVPNAPRDPTTPPNKPKNMPAELRQSKDDVVTAEVGFSNRKSTPKFNPAGPEMANSADAFIESGGKPEDLLKEYGLHKNADGTWIQGPPGKLPSQYTRDRPSLYREGRDYYLSRLETGFTNRLGQGEARRIAEGLNPSQIEKIRSMYTNGQTKRAVAKELGIPINALDYVKKIHGIYPNKPE